LLVLKKGSEKLASEHAAKPAAEHADKGNSGENNDN